MSQKINKIILLTIVPLMFALGGCEQISKITSAQSNPYEGMSDEDQLRARSQERYDALIAMDMAKVYSFATPSYRATFDQRHHAGQYGGQIQRERAQVNKIEIDESGDTATVQMELWSKTSGFGSQMIELSTYSNATWVKRDGLWWFVEPR